MTPSLPCRVRHGYTAGRDFSHCTRTRKHHTRFCTVSHETRSIKITITNSLYLCLLVSHETRGIMHTCAIKIIKSNGRGGPTVAAAATVAPCLRSPSPALVHVCQLSFTHPRLPAPIYPLPFTHFRSPILVHCLPPLVHHSHSRSAALPHLFTTVHTHWLFRSSPPRPPHFPSAPHACAPARSSMCIRAALVCVSGAS
jgi:hypothetical protein